MGQRLTEAATRRGPPVERNVPQTRLFMRFWRRCTWSACPSCLAPRTPRPRRARAEQQVAGSHGIPVGAHAGAGKTQVSLAQIWKTKKNDAAV